jgi:nucleoside diphosphate kinase
VPARGLQAIVGADRLGLVILSPDCARSGLLTAIEQELAVRSGCVPVFRRAFRHDDGSIRSFYPHTWERDPLLASLVRDLFISSSSWIVLYEGDDAPTRLRTLKGASHPAFAEPATVRARYWCDNSVCNLIHVSDDADEIERELSVLATAGFEVPTAVSACSLAPFPDPRGGRTIEHNGAVVFLRQLTRLAALDPGLAAFPDDGDAWRCELTLRSLLGQVLSRATPQVARIVSRFQRGDIGLLEDFRPYLSPWETLVFGSRLATQHKWSRVDLGSAVAALEASLADVSGWLLSGSAALARHGLDVEPRDIDLWCTNDALDAIARWAGRPTETKLVRGFEARRVVWHHAGWEVEAVGPLTSGARRLMPDEAMLGRARGRLEPIEDLLVELIVLDRPAPKNDVSRARLVRRRLSHAIDEAYLRRRAAHWNADLTRLAASD